ncbi:MAG: VIT domain-containing protein [Planctomycetota bacterium JB042]
MSWSRSTPLVSLALALLLGGSASASGFLVASDGSPLRLRSQRVAAVVEDGFARTTVRQTFAHAGGAGGGALEAVYVFPVPDGAALVDLALEVGGQRLEGLLAERKAARRAYDAIVGRKRDPALVEQIGRSKFRLSVYPVLPDQPTTVELTWVELVPRVAGALRYVYPLALLGDAATTEHDLTVDVTLRSAGATIAEASSPTAGLDVVRVSDHEVRASLERTGATLDEDVVVRAAIRTPQPSLSVHVHRMPGGDAFLAAVVTPPDPDAARVLPRDVTLALDVSGSMDGPKLEQAKAAARALLDGLRPTDRMNVLLFSHVVRRFADAPVPATVEAVAAGRAFVDAAEAKGSTALGDAIAAACAAPVAAGRVGTVVLLTDGRPTVGEQDPARIVALARAGGERGLRVFTFGVGDDVGAGLLDGVAAAGGGVAELFRREEEVESRLVRFLHRTASPAIADLSITVGGKEVDDRFPRPLPAVHLGEQVCIAGRVGIEGRAPVVVRGTVDGARLELSTTADFGRRAVGVPSRPPIARERYGRAALTYLERALRLRGALEDEAYFAAIDRGTYSTEDEVVAAVIDTSLDTVVQSAYTSFLALLPEDRARVDARDAAARAEALPRARARKVELAGVAPDDAPETADGEVAIETEARAAPEAEATTPRQILGVGGGAGGRFGGKYGGRGAGRGGGRASQAAVTRNRDWLESHQDPRGFWSSAGFSAHCATNVCDGAGDPARDVGVTGLSLLSFLGAGHTVNHGTKKAVVRRGLKFLLSIQDPDRGSFGEPGSHPESLLDHAIAALAMTEGYGLSKWPILKDPAQRGIDHLVSRRSPDGSWGDGDLEVTTWAVLGLRSALDFGLTVDPAALDGARAFVESVTDDATGLVPGAETVRGFASSAERTAAAMICRIFLGEETAGSPALRAGAALLRSRLPRRGEPSRTLDPRTWLWGSYAMFQIGGPDWDAWEAAMLEQVVKSQRRDGDEKGSWDAPPRSAAHGVGRVGSTAVMSLCLEVDYRYDRILLAR